jgi:hypothetical protein
MSTDSRDVDDTETLTTPPLTSTLKQLHIIIKSSLTHPTMHLIPRRPSSPILLKVVYRRHVLVSRHHLVLPVVFFLLFRRFKCLRLSFMEVKGRAFHLRRFLREENVPDRGACSPSVISSSQLKYRRWPTGRIELGIQKQPLNDCFQAAGSSPHCVCFPCNLSQRATREMEVYVVGLEERRLLPDKTVLRLGKHAHQSFLVERRYSANLRDAADKLGDDAVLLEVGGLYVV